MKAGSWGTVSYTHLRGLIEAGLQLLRGFFLGTGDGGVYGIVLLFLGDLFLTLGDRVRAAKQDRPDAHNHGHGSERSSRIFAGGLGAEILVEAHFLELSAGNGHPRGAAHFVLAVHMVLVAFGMSGDAIPRDLDQILALAEHPVSYTHRAPSTAYASPCTTR